MRAINNQTVRGCGFGGHFGAYVFHGFGHGLGIVVRAVNRAAQHHMAVRVAKGLDCAGTPQMVNAEERVLLSSGEATVDRCLHRAVSGVLEADRHGKPAGQLAVDLAFRVARTNGAPTHRVRDELRAGGLQKFRGGRQSFLQHTKQGFASKQQAFANIVAAINIRVVDQALPADGGARLLEVHAHDDEQLLTELVLQLGQSARVVQRGLRVMNRTGADDDQQPVVLAVQARANLITRVGDDFLSLIGQREFSEHLRGRGQRLQLQYAAVDDATDTHLIFPARHISGNERVLPLPHRLTNGAKLFRGVQRLRTDLQRMQRMCCFLLLLHNISPWISIFPKDKVSREQTDMTTVIGKKCSLSGSQ